MDKPAYAILGPCRCQSCDVLVWWARSYTRAGWNGPVIPGLAWWRERTERIHKCGQKAAAA